MLRQALKDSLIYAIAAILSRGLTIIQVPLFSAILLPQQFGLLDIIGLAVNLVNLVIAFEISQGVAIYFSESKDLKERQAYASTSLWFTIACYSLFTVIAWPFSKEIFGLILGSRAQLDLAEIFLISAFANALFLITQNQLRWMLRAKDYLFVSVVHGFTIIILSLIFLQKMGLQVRGMMYAQIISSILGAVMSLFLARDMYKLTFDTACLKKMLAFSIPLVPSSVSVFFSLYIDRLCIKSFLGMYEVGLYGVAYRFASVVGVIIIGFSRSFTPLIYNNSQDAQTPLHISSLFKFFTFISLVSILFLGIFSREFMLYLASPEYMPAHTLIPVLAASLIIGNFYIFMPGLALKKKTTIIALISVAAALINVIINLALVPQIGIYGSACATLASAMLSSFLWLFFGQKHYPVKFEWKKIFHVTLFCLLLLLVNYTYLQGVDLLSTAVRAICFLAACVTIMFWLASKEELQKIRSLFTIIHVRSATASKE